jgi:hypothetical protein
MESPWTWALVVLALFALWCSRSLPRAWQWIAFGGLVVLRDNIVSGLWVVA